MYSLPSEIFFVSVNSVIIESTLEPPGDRGTDPPVQLKVCVWSHTWLAESRVPCACSSAFADSARHGSGSAVGLLLKTPHMYVDLHSSNPYCLRVNFGVVGNEIPFINSVFMSISTKSIFTFPFLSLKSSSAVLFQSSHVTIGKKCLMLIFRL